MTVAVSSSASPTQDTHGIDTHNGFLPSSEPLSRLGGEYEQWEVLLDRAQALPLLFAGGGPGTSEASRQQARQWRSDLRRVSVDLLCRAYDRFRTTDRDPQMAILPLTDAQLSDVRFARRCRVALSFLAHFYIHSQPEPQSRQARSLLLPRWTGGESLLAAEEARGAYKATVPASISVPWCTVSQHLELPTVLTYADTVLWNWHLTTPSLGVTSSNLSMTTTFSGTATEHHFYKTALLIELQGAEALRLIQASLPAMLNNDVAQVRDNLTALCRVIEAMRDIFVDITTACVPDVFYWDVRTWFNGSDTSATTFDERGQVQHEAGRGWELEGVQQPDGSREDPMVVTLSGPSAGQSSVIHTLDVFLGVNHSEVGQKPSFMQRMQAFMPGPHRRYLSQLGSFLCVPGGHMLAVLAAHSPPSQHCLSVYNAALDALCSLRDQHMRIVALYILIPARNPRRGDRAPLSEQLRVKRGESGLGERGTGGTELVSFLKRTRQRTREALLTVRTERTGE